MPAEKRFRSRRGRIVLACLDVTKMVAKWAKENPKVIAEFNRMDPHVSRKKI